MESKTRSAFRPEKFFWMLMGQKKKQVQHHVTVTVEVHKPGQPTPVQRKQPTPKQLIPFGKMPSEQENVESSSLSSVISPRTKDVISRNVAQLIAQNIFKAKELEQRKQNIDTDKEIEVVGHREGTIMRGLFML